MILKDACFGQRPPLTDPALVTGMKVGGADLSGRDRMVLAYGAPSGTEAPGARGAGRPINSMSRELELVAGRLCDSPGCAESADP